MPKCSDPDPILRALANSTRRAVFERLCRGPASVSDLAEPFDMALPSFMQHLGVLEDAGLVRSYKRGRVRTLEARGMPIRVLSTWLDEQTCAWERRLDRLDEYPEETFGGEA
jgi:DNA-binding transcriptional ArsR family regulator